MNPEVQAIIDMINKMHSNTSLSRDESMRNLEEIMVHCEALQMGLAEDEQREESL